STVGVRTDRKTGPMPHNRTDDPFNEALPRLLAEQGVSLRELSRRLGMDATYLSRIRRGEKRLPARLPRQVSAILGLPEDYFPETREALILEAIRRDSTLREQIYDRFVHGRHGAKGTSFAMNALTGWRVRSGTHWGKEVARHANLDADVALCNRFQEALIG